MADPPAASAAPVVHLTRWTVTSGSNARSRGAVILDAGDHHWRASAEGNGAIDALFTAVDKALAEILDGQPRLLAYDLHALGEGTDAVGVVTLRIAPPLIAGERGLGEYEGEARGHNVIAASLQAYLVALNRLLAEESWSGAPEAAAQTGKRARPKAPVSAAAAREQRADLDETVAEIDVVDWFES